MTLDIEHQVRNWISELDELLPEITADQVTSARVGTGPVRPMQPVEPRQQRRWPVAAAAAAAALLLIGGIAFLLRSIGNDEPDVATTVAQTTVATTIPATTVPEAATTVPDQPIAGSNRWDDLPSFTEAGWGWVDTEHLPRGRLTDGTWFFVDPGWRCTGPNGQRFVTEDCEGPVTDPEEVVYLSPDLVAWDAMRLDVFDGLVTSAADMHGRLSSVFVQAWEVEENIAAESPSQTGTSWVSRDGVTWQEIVIHRSEGVPSEPTITAGGINHEAIEAGSIVLTRTDCTISGYLGVSTDGGLTFTIVDGMPGTESIPIEEIRSHTNRLGGPSVSNECAPHSRSYGHHALFTIGGVFYGVGYATPEAAPVVWRSEDGFVWERVGDSDLPPIQDQEGGGTLTTVDLGNAVVVGVPAGTSGDGEPVGEYFLSSDGLSWSPVDVPTCNGSVYWDGWMVGAVDGGGTPWVMLNACGDLTGPMVGRYDGGSFTWFRAYAPEEVEITFGVQPSVFPTGQLVWIRSGGGGDPAQWVAVPPQ